MSDVEPQVPDDPFIGRMIDNKYRVIRLCGRGGMGAVYEGLNVALGKRVALKFIDPELARNHDGVQRFLREARAASAAESAHIVQVFDVYEGAESPPYIVMELLTGEDLGTRLRRLGSLSHEEAVPIAIQTLRGLRRAHAMGIVHRDLKPDNIFLVQTDDDPSFVKIVDFGISKISRRNPDLESGTLTQKGVVLGTPFYMSPEQAQALPELDARADLWAVGAILFECLAGHRTHQGSTYEQVIISICTTEAPDIRNFAPDVPGRIANAIRKALARDLAERFQSAEEFADALRGANPEQISANPSSPRDISLERTLRSEPLPLPNTRSSWTSDTEKEKLAERQKNPPIRSSRSRSTLLVLGLSVMFAGFVATVILMGSRRLRDSNFPIATGLVSPSAVRAADKELRILTRPANASLHIDGQPNTDRVLRGPLGSSHQVRVEAEGHVTSELSVVLDNTTTELRVELRTVTPDIVSIADAGRIKARPSIAQPSASSNGIAGGLKLKTDFP